MSSDRKRSSGKTHGTSQPDTDQVAGARTAAITPPPPLPAWVKAAFVPTALTVIVAIGVYLRFHNISGRTMWYDEIDTALGEAQPIFGPQGILPYVNPGRILLSLYGLGLRASYALFGVTTFAARFPSALFGVLSIPLVYRWARSSANAAVGLMCAALLAVNYSSVDHSVECRFYSLTVLTGLLFLIACEALLTGPNMRKGIALVAGATILALLSQPTQYAYILAGFLYLLIVFAHRHIQHKMNQGLLRGRHAVVGIYVALIGGCAIGVAGLGAMLRFIGRRLLAEVSVSKAAAFQYPSYDFTFFYGKLLEFFCSDSPVTPQWAYWIPKIALPLLILGYIRLVKKRSRLAVLAPLWLTLFIAMYALVQPRIVLYQRYVMPSLPMILFLISHGILWLWEGVGYLFGGDARDKSASHRASRFTALALKSCLVVAAMAFWTLNLFSGWSASISGRTMDWSGMVAYLNKYAKDDNVFIARCPGGTMINEFQWYFIMAGKRSYLMPTTIAQFHHFEQQGARAWIIANRFVVNANSPFNPDIPGHIQKYADTHYRPVIVDLNDDPKTPLMGYLLKTYPKGMVEQARAAGSKYMWPFMNVELYTQNDPSATTPWLTAFTIGEPYTLLLPAASPAKEDRQDLSIYVDHPGDYSFKAEGDKAVGAVVDGAEHQLNPQTPLHARLEKGTHQISFTRTPDNSAGEQKIQIGLDRAALYPRLQGKASAINEDLMLKGYETEAKPEGWVLRLFWETLRPVSHRYFIRADVLTKNGAQTTVFSPESRVLGRPPWPRNRAFCDEVFIPWTKPPTDAKATLTLYEITDLVVTRSDAREILRGRLSLDLVPPVAK